MRSNSGERDSFLFLIRWWCDFYKRPYKDPVLQSYSFEELLYEYYSVKEAKVAEQESIQAEADKIEESKDDEAQKWADQMEAEEEEGDSLLEDPNTKEWMEKQIALDKQMFGEEFGEDMALDFSDLPSETNE